MTFLLVYRKIQTSPKLYQIYRINFAQPTFADPGQFCLVTDFCLYLAVILQLLRHIAQTNLVHISDSWSQANDAARACPCSKIHIITEISHGQQIIPLNHGSKLEDSRTADTFTI
jgi:hypothetical protein